jgi:hypothetical protein
MKLITQITAAVATLLLALNASASERIERDYAVKDVLEVEVTSGIKLELTQGETESLKLKTSADMLKQIHVDLTNNKLSLRVEKKLIDITTWFNQGEVVFTLALKNFHSMQLAGGVDARIGNLNLAALSIKASGGTDVNFAQLQVKELSIEASGGSDVEAASITSDTVRINVSGGSGFKLKDSGKTNLLNISASGGSGCKAKKLESITAEVIAGGGSDVDVQASRTLKVNAGGASDIHYYGNPQVNSSIGGASHLNAHQ